MEAPPLALLSSWLPARSETFVWREVRALRATGWPVTAVSLHDPLAQDRAELPDVADDLVVVYGNRTRAVLSAMRELVTHPWRALGTLGLAFVDAVAPGEPLGARERLKLLPQAGAALGLAHRLRVRGVRHLHCHFAHAPATVGMYAARQLGVTFSVVGHANDLFQRRALLRRKLQRAAFFACISEWHRALYRDEVPRARLELVRCGVDTQQWGPKARARGVAFEVLTVCRLVEKKGVDTLLRALALLSQDDRCRDARLTVAGDGPEGERLAALARELGVAERVRWLGAVRNDRVRELLAEVDVFALACRTDRHGDRDGVPVVLMEAMACCVPVVVGDLPAIRELVEHGVSGYLVPADGDRELAERLAQLAADGDARRRLGDAGRRRVEAEFSLAANIERLTSGLRRVVR